MMIKSEEIESPLWDLKYMAEFAAELAGRLEGRDETRGTFEISITDGNRLVFCCNDILERVEKLTLFFSPE